MKKLHKGNSVPIFESNTNFSTKTNKLKAAPRNTDATLLALNTS